MSSLPFSLSSVYPSVYRSVYLLHSLSSIFSVKVEGYLVHFIKAVAKGAPQSSDVHPQRSGRPKGEEGDIVNRLFRHV